MFGFVKPFVPLLRVSEYEFYRGAYCGLCHAMSKRTGAISCASLSYDMVFFALVRGALMGDKYILRKKRCLLHPIKKRTMMMRSPSLEYTARVNSILVYYKLRDDVSDERGLKRTAARVASSAFRGGRVGEYAALDSAVASAISDLTAIENARTASPDEAAETFGGALSVCLSYGLDGANRRIACEIGRHLGRAVYLADAACDFRKDKKSGSYNPFVLAFDGKMGEQEAQMVKNAVLMELSALESALQLIDYTDFDLTRECVMNVATFGIKNAFFSEFEKEKQHDKPV